MWEAAQYTTDDNVRERFKKKVTSEKWVLNIDLAKCGQKKNKTVMAYCCWRILAGLEKSITLPFMIVRHTRCCIDGGFGLAKKKFRSSDCDTPEQLQATISASAERNTTDLFQWQWHDWDEFLGQKFRRIVRITKFQHFRFSEKNFLVR